MIKSGKLRFLGIIILLFILLRADWIRIMEILQVADLLIFGVCMLMTLPMVWIKSERWRSILAVQGHFMKSLDSFLIYMSSIFLGLVTPGRIGEFSKIVYLKQYGVTSSARAFSSVIMDRLFDIFLLLVIAMYGFISLNPFHQSQMFGWIGMILMLSVFVGFIGYINIFTWIANFFRKVLPLNIFSRFSKWSDLIFYDIKHIQRKSLLWMTILTTVSYAIFCLQYYLMAGALGISISYINLVSIVAISGLFSMIPITIAGLGTREAIFLLFFMYNFINLFHPVLKDDPNNSKVIKSFHAQLDPVATIGPFDLMVTRRGTLNKASLIAFKETFPWGIGPGQFKPFSARIAVEKRLQFDIGPDPRIVEYMPHSTYFGALAQLGVLGILSILILWVLIGYGCYQIFQVENYRGLAIGLSACFFSASIIAIAVDIMNFRQLWWLVAITAVLWQSIRDKKATFYQSGG